MSAVVSPKNGSNVVNFKSSSRRNFLQYLAKLSTVESEVIADIETQSDTELLETRNHASRLGKSQWRIEAACDAEIWTRANRQVGGRGKKDSDETGIGKLIEKRARQIGCTPETIKTNRRIFNLMTEVETRKSALPSLEILNEKGFYQAALKAVDPIKAVELFAEEKTKKPTFRVSDSERYLDKNNLRKSDAVSLATESIRKEIGVLSERESMIAHLNRAKRIIQDTLIPDCPNHDFALRLYGTDGLIGEIDSEIEFMSSEDSMSAMRMAWELGCRSEKEMAEHTLFPIDVVADALNKLSASGEFIKVNRGGKHDSAPGADSQIWHKAGEPLGDDYKSARSATVSDEDDEDW